MLALLVKVIEAAETVDFDVVGRGWSNDSRIIGILSCGGRLDSKTGGGGGGGRSSTSVTISIPLLRIGVSLTLWCSV